MRPLLWLALPPRGPAAAQQQVAQEREGPLGTGPENPWGGALALCGGSSAGSSGTFSEYAHTTLDRPWQSHALKMDGCLQLGAAAQGRGLFVERRFFSSFVGRTFCPRSRTPASRQLLALLFACSETPPKQGSWETLEET